MRLSWPVLALLLAGVCCAQPEVRRAPDRVVVRNDQVLRVLQRTEGVWRTVRIARADGSSPLDVTSDEFLIRLMDGTELTAADYDSQGQPTVEPGYGHTRVTISCLLRPGRPSGAPPLVTVTYSVDTGPYLRKSLLLRMAPNGAVDELQVERFRTDVPGGRGGRGEPVFVGDAWFCGLEYPGSQTAFRDGLVTLSHFPGLAKQDPDGKWRVHSKTAVIGTGAKDDPLELAFSDYVDTIRRPARNFMQYNSWYDWRGNQLTVQNLVSTYEAFRKNLVEPFGVKMDAFVPDDGWQNGNSIWVPRENLYPEGFAPLRDALEARGTRMGIWMPLNGTNLNAEWGASQGYEKSNRGGFYCLVGPKYNAAIREATARIITQGNLAYYKHDFNTLRCSAEGHGHLPDDRHGHEANLDAELELLAYERSLQPDIFLNVTSSVWLSPWWLSHADSIWMCASDFGYEKTWPQLSPREWDMSYRDTHFFKVYREQRHLVPASAMMTHGIIHGKTCKLGGPEETLREWSDMVVMYFGRGVQLKELYITPDMVPPDWWQALGHATRWAVDNAPLLEKTVYVGGDPRRGEIHGWAHWLGDRGVLCLRNPDLQDKGVRIPFDKSVQYRGAAGREFHGRVLYPYAEDLPDRFVSGEPITIAVPGASVVVIELAPGAPQALVPASIPALEGATAQVSAAPAALTARLTVPDEPMQRGELYLLARGVAPTFAFGAVTVNAQAVRTRKANGGDWLLHCVDLRPFRGQTVEVAATLPEPGAQPFSGPQAKLSVWWVADRPLRDPLADWPQAEALPQAPVGQLLPVAQSFRRQTTCLLRDADLSLRRTPRGVTETDLRALKAAKLRFQGFDVNGEEQYRDKHIWLNGEKLAQIPPNRGEISNWQETILDLKSEQLGLVKLRNTVKLDTAGGDCFKFTGLCLAVQLADGTWVESSTDGGVYSSVAGWEYTEGTVFRDGRSPAIELTFEPAMPQVMQVLAGRLPLPAGSRFPMGPGFGGSMRGPGPVPGMGGMFRGSPVARGPMPGPPRAYGGAEPRAGTARGRGRLGR
jgi:hypothetical protein